MPYLRRAHNCNSDGVHLDTAATRAGTRLFPDSSTNAVLPLLYLMLCKRSRLALLALHVVAHSQRPLHKWQWAMLPARYSCCTSKDVASI
jgi:hypothetical protein